MKRSMYSNKSQMKEKTILKNLSAIIDFFKKTERDGERSRDIYFTPEKMNSGQCPELDAAAQFLGLTRMQTVLFAVAMHQSRRRNDMDGLASFMNVNYLDFLGYIDDWHALADKWLVRLRDEDEVVVPSDVKKAMMRNIPYSQPSVKGLGTMQILSRIKKLFESRENNEMSSEQMIAMMDALVSENPETSFSAAFTRNGIDDYNSNERAVFYALCHRYFNCNDDKVRWGDIDDYFDEESLDYLRTMYIDERMGLQRRGIIEFCSDDGLVSKDFFHIKDEVKAELFEDAGGLRKKSKSIAELLDPETLPEKELFYDEKARAQVDTLQDLMGEERYSRVCEALKAKGLRTGLTCLLYGPPGTGKTETVYQLARRSGRKLLVADVSRLKDMYVGESEKKVKGLFDNYRRYVKLSDKAPILFFNEADAIFGVRMEGAQRAVDKMENSIQNIILQEMESLGGIMIATTNLPANLDKAFERRFLYKVALEKPSVEAREKIWKSMLGELSTAQARLLAAEFDFSGGQIENISRKRLVKSVIDGRDPSLEDIRAFCAEEMIQKNTCKRIGF